MPHVFISYSHAESDSAYMRLLRDALRMRGFTVWVDEEIPNASRWLYQIQSAIHDSHAFIVIMSPRSQASTWVENECSLALELRLPVFPVVLEGGVWFGFRHLQAQFVQPRRLPDERFFADLQKTRTPSPFVLPSPFAWIDIPAGKVTLVDQYKDTYFGKKGEAKTFDVPAFAIAKYPITNAQFAKFVEAGGYSTEKWWTPEGWKAKQVENWTQPRFWGDSDYEPFNRPEHPVVGVSWFESVAFCLWLSEITNEKIMLPTEQMWQRAAQGDDGRVYPWGNDWDAARCNNGVDGKGIGTTTLVTQYEGRDKGDSPFGVSDMAGNVWEWCLTDYDNGFDEWNIGSKYRVLLGGSWNGSVTYGFRAAFRGGNYPDNRYDSLGFRYACSR